MEAWLTPLDRLPSYPATSPRLEKVVLSLTGDAAATRSPQPAMLASLAQQNKNLKRTNAELLWTLKAHMAPRSPERSRPRASPYVAPPNTRVHIDRYGRIEITEPGAAPLPPPPALPQYAVPLPLAPSSSSWMGALGDDASDLETTIRELKATEREIMKQQRAAAMRRRVAKAQPPAPTITSVLRAQAIQTRSAAQSEERRVRESFERRDLRPSYSARAFAAVSGTTSRASQPWFRETVAAARRAGEPDPDPITQPRRASEVVPRSMHANRPSPRSPTKASLARAAMVKAKVDWQRQRDKEEHEMRVLRTPSVPQQHEAAQLRSSEPPSPPGRAKHWH